MISRQAIARPLAVYLLLFAAAILPLLLVEVAPLVDYPNHLARTYILTHIDGSKDLQRYYAARWAPLPNLAMDVTVFLLGQLVSVETAGKIFLALIFLLLSSGTMAVHAALHRRLSMVPLIALFFLYNSHFLWGFVNYLFGLGLALWLFAAWIYGSEAPPWIRLILFPLASLAVFFSHLFAFGVYILAVGAYELGRGIVHSEVAPLTTVGRLAVAAAQLVPAGLIFVLFSPTSGAPGAIAFGPLFGRIVAPFTVLNSYNRPLDVGTFVLLSLLAAVGLYSGCLRVARSMYAVLGLFALGCFLMPNDLFSATNCLDRMVPPFALLFTASVDITARGHRWVRPVAAALVLLFAVRMGVVAVQWHRASAVYAEYQKAFAQMPLGSRMAVKCFSGSSRRDAIPPQHVGCLAIITRHAFVPLLFAYRSQQPIAIAPPVAHLADRDRSRSRTLEPQLKEYDFLLVINHTQVAYPLPPGFTQVYGCREFCLYRID